MLALLLFVTCLTGGYVSAQSTSQAPVFCKGNECPQFKVLSKYQGYEMRQYGPLTWASTSYAGPWNSNVLGILFGRLYSYIQGNNTMGQRLDMTVPVITTIESAGTSGTRYTMKFMIPSANMKNIPKPIDSYVTISPQPTGTYFVRSFGGYATGPIYMSELQNLVNAINNAKLYNNDIFYTATYDSPSVSKNRHNEVWLKKL